MEVLSGGVGAGAGAGSGSDRDRGLPLPPPPGRRYFRRQASLALSPSDMFLFRPPKPTYVASSWPGDLCVLGSSVCLALERVGGASTVLIFCHGTSSDLGMSRRSLEILRDGLGCHVIGVEYPGYGLTADGEPSEESINAAVRVAFLHLTEVMGWPAEQVVIMGRSLGSGPAARIAREFQPGALFLLAPFTGVADIAGSIVGDTLASMFSLNQWDNKKEVAATSSPTLVLHGLKDQVVPHAHSLDLYRASAATKKYVGLLLDSDHNRISWGVVCDMYARPFMEMVCPGQRDRPLGIRQTDVAKLSNFDPMGKPGLILACAEAVWARRRQDYYGRIDLDFGGGGGLAPSQEAPEESPANTGQAGVTSAAHLGSNYSPAPSSPLRGDGNEHASGTASKVTPSSSPVFVGSSPSTSTAAALADGGARGADVAGGGAGGAPEAAGLQIGAVEGLGGSTAAAAAATKEAARSEQRIGATGTGAGAGAGTGRGWSFLARGGEAIRTCSGGDNNGGAGSDESCGPGVGVGVAIGVGAGGWGTGTVRAPAFEGQAMGKITFVGGNGNGNGGDNPRECVSSDSNTEGASPGRNTKVGKASAGVKLGGAAEYAVVLGRNSGTGTGTGVGGDAESAAESKEAGGKREKGRGWGPFSSLFSGR
eukprot:g10864.t1